MSRSTRVVFGAVLPLVAVLMAGLPCARGADNGFGNRQEARSLDDILNINDSEPGANSITERAAQTYGSQQMVLTESVRRRMMAEQEKQQQAASLAVAKTNTENDSARASRRGWFGQMGIGGIALAMAGALLVSGAAVVLTARAIGARRERAPLPPMMFDYPRG